MIDVLSLPFQPRPIGDYFIYENVFKEGSLQRLEDLLSKLPYENGTVGDNTENSTYRRSNLKWINYSSESEWLYRIFTEIALDSNSIMWNFDLRSFKDYIQYTEYDSSIEGHYDYHIDVGNKAPSCFRKLSIVIQLSDPEEYEGGDLVLRLGKEETKIEKRKGLCVVFPTYFLHKVYPVTSGIRRSLVSWISGPPFK